MSREEYYLYRNEVLSKTNGANIHYVNGKLGLIINSIIFLEKTTDLEKEKYWTDMIPKYIAEINAKIYSK